MDPAQPLLELVKTADGSSTFYRADINEHYHSNKGAVSESLHVFINAGFCFLQSDKLNVLEVGLGTGLNAALTASEALKLQRCVTYTALEPFPPGDALMSSYLISMSGSDMPQEALGKIHEAAWEIPVAVNEYFSITKRRITLQDFHSGCDTDLIYFDAFSPAKQEELWTAEIMQKMHSFLKPDGVLVSYCAQGQFRRNLKAAGFRVKRLKGPPGGKWQMTRARKAV